MRKGRRRISGFSLLEGLISSLIMAVAIVGMFASWSTCFKQNEKNSWITEAEEIGRAQVETAKVFGAANLPTGTYNSSSSTGTWSGAWIPATGWTAGATAYYDGNGNQLTSSTGAVYSAVFSLIDTSVQVGTGTSYSVQSTTLRSGVVTVTQISTNTVVFTMGTNLVEGGI